MTSRDFMLTFTCMTHGFLKNTICHGISTLVAIRGIPILLLLQVKLPIGLLKLNVFPWAGFFTSLTRSMKMQSILKD